MGVGEGGERVTFDDYPMLESSFEGGGTSAEALKECLQQHLELLLAPVRQRFCGDEMEELVRLAYPAAGGGGVWLLVVVGGCVVGVGCGDFRL